MKYIYYLLFVSLVFITTVIVASCGENCSVTPEIEKEFCDQNLWTLDTIGTFDDGSVNGDQMFQYLITPGWCNNCEIVMIYDRDTVFGSLSYFEDGQEFTTTADSSEAITTSLYFERLDIVSYDPENDVYTRFYEQGEQVYKGVVGPQNRCVGMLFNMALTDVYGGGVDRIYLKLK